MQQQKEKHMVEMESQSYALKLTLCIFAVIDSSINIDKDC